MTPFFGRKRRKRTLRADEAAVSDVVGSVLLVSITVVTMGAFSAVILNVPAPADPITTRLHVDAIAGPDLLWGSGDEALRVHHLGGDPLDQTNTEFILRNGGAETRYSGDQLGFSDGKLRIGETWQVTTALVAKAEVEFVAVQTGSSSQVLTHSKLSPQTASCDPDTTAPGAIFTQDPTDLEPSHGSNPVLITALVVDGCSGVDPAIVPILEHNAGSGDIVMTSAGGNKWTASVPAPPAGWTALSGQWFQYKAKNLQDLDNNTGESTVQQDFVGTPAQTETYPFNFTANTGSVSNFNASKSASDAGAFASVVKAATGSSGKIKLDGDSVISADPKWDSPEKAYTNGGGEAEYDRALEQMIHLGMADPGAELGAVTDVEINIKQRVQDVINDGWRIATCINDVCSALSPFQKGTDGKTTIAYNVTNLRPGGGTWTWDDMKDIEIRVIPVVKHDATNEYDNDGKFRLDHVEVVFNYEPGYDSDVEFQFTGASAGPSIRLEIRADTQGEAYRVSIKEGASWNSRSTEMKSTDMADWSTTLTIAEWNTGNVEVRIEALQTAAPTDLEIDFLRVAT